MLHFVLRTLELEHAMGGGVVNYPDGTADMIPRGDTALRIPLPHMFMMILHVLYVSRRK